MKNYFISNFILLNLSAIKQKQTIVLREEKNFIFTLKFYYNMQVM